MLKRAALASLQHSSAGMWGWLLERYRYESSETDAPPFYGLAAFAYRDYPRKAEPLLTLPRQPSILGLGASRRSVTTHLPVTIPAFGAVRSHLAVTVLKPDDDWLRITPDPAGFVELEQAAPNTPVTVQVPVQVSLRDNAESGPSPRPPGFLLRVQAGSRSYHHRFLLPQLPAAERLDLLLSADPETPAAPIADLRLRPSLARQPYYVYVRNSSDRVRKAGVALWANGRPLPGGETTLTVGPGQTVRAVFPGGAGPAPSVAAAPQQQMGLPELTGPVQIRLFDPERNGALILSRDVRISLARAAEYVQVPSIRFEPAAPGTGSKNRLTVTLRPAVTLHGPPCVAELVLPARRIPGLRAVRDGIFRVQLPPMGEEVKLLASNIDLDLQADEEGSIHLNIDGVPRALVFHTTFARTGEPTVPTRSDEPALRFYAPRSSAPTPAWRRRSKWTTPPRVLCWS